MLNYRKSFTLVEILVALAVGAIIVVATYASYELVATQYKKNMDIADMHTSGRAIMRIIDRDVRMAGFEYRDKDAKVTYGTISSPLTIKDSGNKCCDEVTVVYDYYDEEAKKTERIRIRYWAEAYTSNKGSRHRLYKQIDVLGRNNAILANPIIGSKDLLADFLEDLQIVNIESTSNLYAELSGYTIDVYSTTERKYIDSIKTKNTHHMAFGPDGLLYAVRGGTIYIYNTVTKQQVGKMSTPRSRYFLFGPDGNLYVLNGNNESQIHIYNVSTKNEIGKIHLAYRVDYRKPFAFGPDGHLYVHRKNRDKQIDIYNVTSKKQVDKMNVHARSAELAFGPDGLLYVNRRGAGNVFIYDITTKKLVGQFNRNWYAHHIEFDSNGLLYAISTSNDQRLQIWNVTTKQLVDTMNMNRRAEHIAIKTTRTGQESLVTINLTLRTRNTYGINKEFKKKDYHGGNFKIDKTDKYKRDTFSSTVLVRNLVL